MSDRTLRAALLLYPKDYRADRGAEISDVTPRWPRTRDRSAGPASWRVSPATGCGCAPG